MADIININWPRWIFASITYHFSQLNNGFPFYIEGQNREQTVTNFAEFRMDGPYFNEVSNHYWTVDILAAILIQIVQDGQDIHRLDTIIGIFASAFTTSIPLFKYGVGVDDDQTQFGCLTLSKDPGEKIRIDKYGQIKPGTPITQASIEARYVTTFFTG